MHAGAQVLSLAPACSCDGQRHNSNGCADAKSEKGGVSGRGSRHPVPSRDEGQSEGDAAHRRQAADPVRGGGGDRRWHHGDDLRHGSRQARDRGPLRQVVRNRSRVAGTRQAGAARPRAQHQAESCRLLLRAPGRAARARARRAVRGEARRRRAVRRDARRRPARWRTARAHANDRRVQSLSFVGDRRRADRAARFAARMA